MSYQHSFIACGQPLGQVLVPTEQLEEGADQLRLGGGFANGVEVGGLFEKRVCLGAEGVEAGGLGEGFLPGGGVEDAFFEKVAGEELAGQRLYLSKYTDFVKKSCCIALEFRTDLVVVAK